MERLIRRKLLAWYQAEKQAMPWRESRDPYSTWVSEVMLQQTRVATVIPYYLKWLVAFPDVKALADAPVDRVLANWTGLGYYSRARNLHKGARYIVENHNGSLPKSVAELRTIPGIGPYTAGAIASIAFELPVPAVDGNVIRVISRLYDVKDCVSSAKTQKQIWEFAAQLVSPSNPGDFNQALMEFGSKVCSPNARCDSCPLSKVCLALKNDVVAERPVKKRRVRKEDKPFVTRALLFAEKNQKILLGKRPDSGLYAGLWELPLAATRKKLVLDFATNITSLDKKPQLTYEQELSHRRLDYKVYRCELSGRVTCKDYQKLRWHSKESLTEIGISAATKNVIAKMHKSGKTVRPKKASNDHQQ